MTVETQDIEEKTLSILKVLHGLQKPAGARVIAGHLKELGIVLSEGTVRYHLRIMDERGLTRLFGQQDGRVLTERGTDEVNSVLVRDRVGLTLSRIELLAFRTSFDYGVRMGSVPVDVSIFTKKGFTRALEAMRPAFEAGLGVSDLVAVAAGGERLGDLTVPVGKIGLATVCSLVLNGTLLKAGVPIGSRFGGILQVRNHKPLRFVELIGYAGCSVDPSEIFIRARMTSVGEVVRNGDGTILANFREIPAICRPKAEEIVGRLNEAGLRVLLVMGDPGAPVCGIPVESGKIGMVLAGGLNPAAAAEEAGIVAEHHAMSTLVEYQDLIKFNEITVQ